MLTGRFGNTSGRPYIEARLALPRLDIDGDFSFLVDTGADETFLMPGDGRTLGLNYSKLQNFERSSLGAGGPISSYREPAWIAFSDGANLYGYAITLAILEFREDMLSVPTVLGRDILHRWAMQYRPFEGRLEFEIESADVVIPSSDPISPAALHQ